MGSLNKVMLIGRLGQDPDVRYTQSNTAVATISLATSDRYKDNNGEYIEKTEWHRVVAWAGLAEICQRYLKKGSLVYFEGSIQTRQWDDKDGNKRYTTEIKALSMQMLDSANSGSSSQQGSAPTSKPAAKPATSPANLNEGPPPVEDDDLPF